MSAPLRHGDLFSGIGGFALAAKRAGMHTQWFCEIEPRCIDLLGAHFPNRRIHTDVTTYTPSTWGDGPASIDVLTGGFPCQDLSVAGRRAGLSGERSGLWWEFHRLISELTPRWVVIENVPGLLSSNRGRDMGIVLRSLGQLGYGWAYRVLDAQWFGVAQQRRRVFIVGHLGDRARPVQVLFELESLCRDTPPSRAPQQNVAGPLSTGASAGGGHRQDLDGTTYITRVADISGTLMGGQAGGSTHGKPSGTDRSTLVAEAFLPDLSGALLTRERNDPETELLIAHALTSEGADASEDGTGRGTPIVITQDVAHTLVDSGRRGQGGAIDSPNFIAIQNATRGLDQEGIGYREGISEPMYTLDSASQHAVAFTSKDNGRDVQDDLAPTLRVMGHAGSHANGGGQLAVAFAQNQRDEVRELEMAGAVAAEPGMKQQTYVATAFTERTREDGATLESQEEMAYALTNPGAGGRTPSRQVVDPVMQVRRLTPTECERLQGFPDGWTEQFSDAARYRMLGNAVAVPVVTWIMERIAMCERGDL